jgi:sugar phosphate isomerase/epimerase
VDGADFHAGLVGSVDGAAEAISKAMEGSSLVLSSLSLSTNFNQEDPAELRAQIDSAVKWLGVAADVKVPVSRVFGGHVGRDARKDPKNVEAGMARVKEALKELAPVAEEKGVVLALENHGGLPCRGEGQVEVIEAVGSPFLRATVDVGNYMGCPQEPVEGTTAAARYCAYVHLKDNRKLPDGGVEASVIGEGDVDIPACLKVLKDAGYDGFIALEYEAKEDELTAVPKSVAYMKSAISQSA